jgi:SAM-dependent methyltransferase
VVGNAQNLPFGDRAFDQVIMSEVLPYVEDARAAVLEARRVLEQGGKAAVCVPDSGRLAWRLFGTLYQALPNVRASQRRAPTKFTRASIVNLFAENGFREVTCRYICGSELVIVFQKVE